MSRNKTFLLLVPLVEKAEFITIHFPFGQKLKQLFYTKCLKMLLDFRGVVKMSVLETDLFCNSSKQWIYNGNSL